MTEAQMNNGKTQAEDTTMKNETQDQATNTATQATEEESSSWGWKTWTGIALGAVAAVGLGYLGYKEFFSGSDVTESVDSVIG